MMFLYCPLQSGLPNTNSCLAQNYNSGQLYVENLHKLETITISTFNNNFKIIRQVITLIPTFQNWEIRNAIMYQMEGLYQNPGR